jgi:hypothetical protein
MGREAEEEDVGGETGDDGPKGCCVGLECVVLGRLLSLGVEWTTKATLLFFTSYQRRCLGLILV